MHIAGVYALAIGIPACMCFAVFLGIARRWYKRHMRQQNGQHLDEDDEDWDPREWGVLNSELKRKGLRGMGARLGGQNQQKQSLRVNRLEDVPLDNFTSAALELELAETAAMPPAHDIDEDVESPSSHDGAEDDDGGIMRELDRASGLE